MRTPSDVDDSVVEEQPGTLVLQLRIEYHGTLVGVNGSLNLYRAAGTFHSCCDVECMQILVVGGHARVDSLTSGDEKHRIREGINHWCRGDTDVRGNIRAAADICCTQYLCTWWKQVYLP